MQKIWLILIVALTALTLVVSDAEARRLGGGGSFGKQSQSVRRAAPNQSTPSPSNSAAPAAPTGATGTPPKPASPLKGILGGALLGLGLGALLSHFGLGAAMANMLGTLLMVALLAFAVMFILRILRRKSEPGESHSAYAGAYQKAAYTPEIGSRIEPLAASAPAALPLAAGAATSAPWGVPADFDTAAFLRNAKTYFIRLQAAWDKADISDIREFTTPEMFAELKMQIQERGTADNTTDVVAIDAELLGIETISDGYLASVKFSGMISEAAGAPAAPFAEVWNLSKPVSGNGGWSLAGIQQLSEPAH